MVEGGGAGGPENGPGSKPTPLVEAGGGRVRLTVQLTPGETTIVSWKKLLREANLSESGRPGPSAPGPSVEAQSACVSEPLPPPPPVAASHEKETVDNEPKEAQANRLNNVIERIERMYAGDGSSDEEDLVLDNMPDDDEYDTEDSFIDDTELDDYFQVDNSATKHDGFFVNRGKLERIEPTISMDQQQKKRRRKDLVHGVGSEDGHKPHKITKMGNKGRKKSSSIPSSSTGQLYKDVIPKVDMVVQDYPANPTEVSIKKTGGIQVADDPSGLQKGDAIGQQISEVNSSEKHISHWKESELQNTSTQKSNDKISYKECLMDKGEGSSVRPKSSSLEKAFAELEKIVEQFRPPSTEPLDPVSQSQSVKRRLPPEIKLKLAKVARIAGSIHGKIPKDVINRLMSILGHLMQITTLKRNLRAMANMGLSAKQQKDDQIQKMKQEVAEMVMLRSMRMKSKLEQHDSNPNDFQEADPEEREAFIRKHSMDDTLENKICDLYDLYVERLEEDSGPLARKLYEELVLLWPSGFMHTDGIKRAIYRAKGRKGLCNYRKDREGIKKKVLATKEPDASNAAQTTNTRKKALSHDRGSALVNNAAPGAARAPVAPSNGSNLDKPKKEKAKKSVSRSNSPNPANVKPSSSDALLKKKVKGKSSAEVAEAKLRLQKLVISQGGETTHTR